MLVLAVLPLVSVARIAVPAMSLAARVELVPRVASLAVASRVLRRLLRRMPPVRVGVPVAAALPAAVTAGAPRGVAAMRLGAVAGFECLRRRIARDGHLRHRLGGGRREEHALRLQSGEQVLERRRQVRARVHRQRASQQAAAEQRECGRRRRRRHRAAERSPGRRCVREERIDARCTLCERLATRRRLTLSERRTSRRAGGLQLLLLLVLLLWRPERPEVGTCDEAGELRVDSLEEALVVLECRQDRRRRHEHWCAGAAPSRR